MQKKLQENDRCPKEIKMKFEFPDMPYINDARFFCDTLTKDRPYIALEPRNHESFAFVTNGTLGYTKDDKTVPIKEGQVAYIAKGSVDKSFAYQCDSVSYMAVNFNFEKKVQPSSGSFPFKTVCSDKNAYLYEKLFQKAVNEYSLNLPGTRMICNGILCQMIGMLYNDLRFDNINYKMAGKIETALDYLNQNYSRPDLKICELAEITGISDKHFRRLFWDIYQKTPHEFLRDFRLNKAELLLLNTSKSISEIALWCGFSDVYSFSHCFKQNFGVPPKVYRENRTYPYR